MRRGRGSERRRFTRVDGDLIVACRPVTRSADDAVAGRTLNFSAGGVLFVSPTPLEAGQDVEMVLRLPPEKTEVRFCAHVVRVRTLSDHVHEVAAEMSDGDVTAQRQLLAFIAEHASHEPEPSRPISA